MTVCLSSDVSDALLCDLTLSEIISDLEDFAPPEPRAFVGEPVTRDETTHPSQEEHALLLNAVQRGRRAASVLAEATQTSANDWRLWARARLLDRPPQTDLTPHLRALPRHLRVETQALYEGEQALLEVVERNLKLVYAVIHRYLQMAEEPVVQHFVGDGVLGLMIAADRFDPRRGLQFSTYAYHWVRQTVTRAMVRDRMVYIPEEARREMQQQNADQLLILQKALSLEANIPGTDIALGETLKGADDPAERAINRWQEGALWRALKAIGPLHGLALGLYTGVITGAHLTVKEVAQLLDLTHEGCEKVIKEARKRMLFYLNAHGLSDLL